jgi:hypothetical protein
MTQSHEPDEVLRAALQGLLGETTDQLLTEVRERALRVRLQPDAEDVATLLVRDIPLVLAEADLRRMGSEQKDRVIDSLEDEHRSLDLAVRALQTAVDQQQTELEALRARLDVALAQRSQLVHVLSALLSATVEQGLRPENRHVYSAALASLQTVLSEEPAEL